ncbi:hypothetical protein CYMTET_31747 [Cymbomonas tetramitiformis]|uniref:Uncharacterized protein n=1 Tax=Cymbomonas tetramitiformis TaxID=36881 RepID=A0AAE0KSX6_9CHLO|nr:hypothetical protein CYMTET_31747 [Cymbomonas tetramitiformis]
MEATTKLALQTLKSLSGEFVLSEQEFKTEKRKLFGKEGHSYVISPDLISKLRELKSFFDDEILDREEFDSQKRRCLDKTVRVPVSIDTEILEDTTTTKPSPPASETDRAAELSSAVLLIYLAILAER